MKLMMQIEDEISSLRSEIKAVQKEEIKKTVLRNFHLGLNAVRHVLPYAVSVGAPLVGVFQSNLTNPLASLVSAGSIALSMFGVAVWREMKRYSFLRNEQEIKLRYLPKQKADDLKKSLEIKQRNYELLGGGL